VCTACNRIGYIINKDILDGCSVADFLESFTPAEGVEAIEDSIEITNVDGNISIDCPFCNANKALYLIGKASYG